MADSDDSSWFSDDVARKGAIRGSKAKPAPPPPTPIAPGDVVRLRSGGPAMTVLEIAPPDGQIPALARCLWMTDAGLGGPLGIPLFALVKVEAPHG